MSENTTIEQRLSAVENELRNLKRKIESSDSWYDRLAGAHPPMPGFFEAWLGCSMTLVVGVARLE